MRTTPDYSHLGHCSHVIYAPSVHSKDSTIWCDDCGTLVLVKDSPTVAVFRCKTCQTRWTGGTIAAEGRYVKHRKVYPRHDVYVAVDGRIVWSPRKETHEQLELPMGECSF